MHTLQFLLACTTIAILGCSSCQQPSTELEEQYESITRIEMQLSAFGVESDDFPSIRAVVDLSQDTSFCVKSFYSSAFEGSTYSLSKNEMQSVRALLDPSDIENLKAEYSVSKTDQPRSTTTFHTTKRTFAVDDYGLEGEYPLQELYEIVYRYGP